MIFAKVKDAGLLDAPISSDANLDILYISRSGDVVESNKLFLQSTDIATRMDSILLSDNFLGDSTRVQYENTIVELQNGNVPSFLVGVENIFVSFKYIYDIASDSIIQKSISKGASVVTNIVFDGSNVYEYAITSEDNTITKKYINFVLEYSIAPLGRVYLYDVMYNSTYKSTQYQLERIYNQLLDKYFNIGYLKSSFDININNLNDVEIDTNAAYVSIIDNTLMNSDELLVLDVTKGYLKLSDEETTYSENTVYYMLITDVDSIVYTPLITRLLQHSGKILYRVDDTTFVNLYGLNQANYNGMIEQGIVEYFLDSGQSERIFVLSEQQILDFIDYTPSYTIFDTFVRNQMFRFVQVQFTETDILKPNVFIADLFLISLNNVEIKSKEILSTIEFLNYIKDNTYLSFITNSTQKYNILEEIRITFSTLFNNFATLKQYLSYSDIESIYKLLLIIKEHSDTYIIYHLSKEQIANYVTMFENVLKSYSQIVSLYIDTNEINRVLVEFCLTLHKLNIQ